MTSWAVVGDEHVVCRGGQLGGAPIGGSVPITGAANPHEVGGVCCARSQDGGAKNPKKFRSVAFHNRHKIVVVQAYYRFTSHSFSANAKG